MDSDDRILDIIGLLIVLGVVAGIGILVFFGGNTGPANPQPAPPDANWTLSRMNATHVQVGHLGGDAVESENLLVTVGGEQRPARWSETTVDRGRTGTVRADANQSITLYWTGSPSEDRVELAAWA